MVTPPTTGARRPLLAFANPSIAVDHVCPVGRITAYVRCAPAGPPPPTR